jgi:hypothetical protein
MLPDQEQFLELVDALRSRGAVVVEYQGTKAVFAGPVAPAYPATQGSTREGPPPAPEHYRGQPTADEDEEALEAQLEEFIP